MESTSRQACCAAPRKPRPAFGSKIRSIASGKEVCTLTRQQIKPLHCLLRMEHADARAGAYGGGMPWRVWIKNMYVIHKHDHHGIGAVVMASAMVMVTITVLFTCRRCQRQSQVHPLGPTQAARLEARRAVASASHLDPTS
eukprot:m.261450 g.261450  ORF g.261450 m.261450 type:complete len:141 (-) comp19696_c0_seq16:2471-2893(-)